MVEGVIGWRGVVEGVIAWKEVGWRVGWKWVGGLVGSGLDECLD